MAATGQAQQKPAGKSSLLVRIALFVTLALVIICAVRWLSLKGELQRGVALFEDNKYQQAADVLEPLMHRPLARIKIRAAAAKTLGLCKEEIASEIALKERTPEGYTKALKLLDEAKALTGSTPEIERRIKEYSGYLQKPEVPATPPIPPATPPVVPPVAPPAAPPATTPKAPPATSPPA